jgi:hypothetical protein
MRTTANIKVAALLATLGLATMAVYQLMLAAGAPFGEAAYGGTHHGQLPAALRVASGISIAIYIIAILVISQRSGLSHLRLPHALGRVGSWVLGVVLTLGAVMNLMSQSPWERFLLGPFTFMLAAMCLVVALGPHDEGEPSQGEWRPLTRSP